MDINDWERVELETKENISPQRVKKVDKEDKKTKDYLYNGMD